MTRAPLLLAALLALAPATLVGCTGNGTDTSDITDVPHTDVERQSIGNCWLYAEASWVESMHLSATGEKFDTSQSYWTYWHWYEQITEESVDAIETGGFFSVAGGIIQRRGLMAEPDFVKEDTTSEMSYRQSSALAAINNELKSGRLKTWDARSDRKLVRQVLDEAWTLSAEVTAQLGKVFGDDYAKSLEGGATTDGTSLIAAKDFAVQYTERETDPNVATVKDTTLDVALGEWRERHYSFWDGDLDADRRAFQIRVQTALHDRQPVVITWDVDFNAMEGSDPVLRGSFNLTTLKKAGKPGRQGGHMTVLEDYQANTEEFGLLAAGVTLDPSNPDDAAKLAAALLPSTTIQFFRIKNSWGALRDDRASAPGFPGYHDLYMDYLNGPITFCPSVEGEKTAENCKGTTTPFSAVILPPGY